MRGNEEESQISGSSLSGLQGTQTEWSRVLDLSKDGPQPKGTGSQIYTKKSQDCPGVLSGRKQPRLMLRKRHRT